ncbi:MAG: hypothetical protein IT519_11570 [Burkholderiales bacterium]|nr:hypothetical protein [Burkholderiales bacterium]
MAREAYEIGKEQEAEAAAQAEALENALHDDETPTAPQDVIDALIADENDARELTEAEASAAIEAAMQQRIAEAIDNDLETRARVTAIPVSGFAAQITEERGEAWAKAGEALEPEPAKKPEDLDGF